MIRSLAGKIVKKIILKNKNIIIIIDFCCYDEKENQFVESKSERERKNV